MKASVVDLRYRMNEILRAIDRNEEVTILYHGKAKGIIRPKTSRSRMPVTSHPFFGMDRSTEPVDEVMDDLRGGRYRVV